MKCSYKLCKNTNKSHSMFRFPIKDLDRLKIWIKNSGKIYLPNMPIDRWKRRSLCSVHFESKYLSKGHKRTQITMTAIPRHYKCEDELLIRIKNNLNTKLKAKAGSEYCPVLPEKPPASSEYFPVLPVKPPLKVYQKKSCNTNKEKAESSSSLNLLQSKEKKAESSSSLDLSQWNEEFNDPLLKLQNVVNNNNCMNKKCVETRRLWQDSRKTFKEQNALITWLSKQLATNNLYKDKYPSIESKTIVHMQLHDGTEKWNEEEKHLSLALFQESPECYSFMLKEGIVLPDLATINKWLSETGPLRVAEDGSVRIIDDFEADSDASEERDGEFGAIVKEEFEDSGTAAASVQMMEGCGYACGENVKMEREEEFKVNVKEEPLEVNVKEEPNEVIQPTDLFMEIEIKCE